jgi:SPOR domain
MTRMQPAHDLLAADEAELKSLRGRRRLLAAAVVLGALLPFIYGVWFAYDRLIAGGGRGDPPLIKAESGPIKVAPADPGGVAIPNQDKQVYDRVKGGDATDRAADRLLPPPERSSPLPLPPPPMGTAMTNLPPPPAAPAASDAMKKAADATKLAAVPPSTAQPPAARPVTTTPPNVSTAAIRPPSSNAPRTIRIQLASFRDTISAIAAWRLMEKQHPGVLAGLTPTYEQVDLPGKGVYHRVQAGPFPDNASAEAACGKLRAAKQDCIVVAR